MIYRNILKYLEEWKDKAHRKPLVLRGARQVGKSSVVRELARLHFDNLIEINLETDPQDGDLILGASSPAEAIKFLAAKLEQPIRSGSTLVFLDEIQFRPELIGNLRYWYETLPDLHLIAAGSLLEFALADAKFSMPVGRIEYCFMGPISFSEFLQARSRRQLAELLAEFKWGDDWPESIHRELLSELKQYWIVGGMPEAVAVYIKENSFVPVEQIKTGITLSYRDDFSKYAAPRVNHEVLRKVFYKAPILVGKRAKLVEFDRESSSVQLRKALDLLVKSQVLTKVTATKATGVPLGAEAQERLAKYLFVDIGLQLSLCEINPVQLLPLDDLLLVNRGSLAEQFIGQHLLRLRQPYQEPGLFYWERSAKSSSAELDYVLSLGGEVVPVEVKSGALGRMKSLQLFLQKRSSKKALRFSSNKPHVQPLSHEKTLYSLPLYFVEQTERLILDTDSA